ncbi:polysaccharide lyase family 14 protein [Fistulina hepatica ATCC 64428]|uniref:Polysaccharide lyase family 14 protein n=1 Tax=Fistulina hepatica ATCC 64428 TaxID=1128425 RepID=A0A0D7ALV0_9AGAR|nr:polysaccharide lyase family 14 protein [Fistulina hepatica ATCC 64428]
MRPSQLIPVSEYITGFTTCHDIDPHHLDHVQLSDDKLAVHKVTKALSHNLVTPPAPALPELSPPSPMPKLPPPRKAWEAVYPKGSVNPAGSIPGGFGFSMSGTHHFAQKLEHGATEVIMSYRFMLDPHWDWVKGGKLPGVFGGVGDLAYGCTGGRQNDRCECFNLRPMWRADSLGELYVYLPPLGNNQTRLLEVPPTSCINPDYGVSVGRGSFKLQDAVGRWAAIAIRVKLNDVEQENGEFQLWFNGVSAMTVDGLVFRKSEDSKIKGMHFQTFFGGHGVDWAAPKDLRAWFADVTGVILQ